MKRLLMIGCALATLAPAVAGAKEIGLAEWLAESAANKVAVENLEASNVVNVKANANPWGTPAAWAYMAAHPYDPGDLVAGPNGYALPGWAQIINPASGGQNGSSSSGN